MGAAYGQPFGRVLVANAEIVGGCGSPVQLTVALEYATQLRASVTDAVAGVPVDVVCELLWLSDDALA